MYLLVSQQQHHQALLISPKLSTHASQQLELKSFLVVLPVLIPLFVFVLLVALCVILFLVALVAAVAVTNGRHDQLK